MRKLNLTEANAFLIEVLQDPKKEPAVLMRGKKPVAVIVPVGDADMETVGLSFSPTFHEILEQSRRSAVTEGTFTSEEIRQEFGLPPYQPSARNSSTHTAKLKARKPAKDRKMKA